MLRILAFFILALAVLSCASKTETTHDDHSATGSDGVWKDMDDFHLLMAETFHPFKDSSNLEPAKARAGELASAAEAWAQAPLPEKVDSDEVKAKLQQLKSETATLAGYARSADDNVIAEQLTKVHETFHAIQEAWYAP